MFEHFGKRVPENGPPIFIKEMALLLVQESCSNDFFKSPGEVEFAGLLKKISNQVSNFDIDNPVMIAHLFQKYFAEIPEGAILPQDCIHILNSNGVEDIQRILEEMNTARVKLLSILFFSLKIVLLKNCAHTKFSHENNMKFTIPVAKLFSRIIFKHPEYKLNMSHSRLCKEKEDRILIMIEHCEQLFDAPIQETIISKVNTPNIYKFRKRMNYYKQKLEFLFRELNNKVEIFQLLDGDLDEKETLLAIRRIRYEIEKIRKNIDSIKYEQDETAVGAITILESGFNAIRGRRPTMEDAHIVIDDLNEYSALFPTDINRSLYGVYDGHGGQETSKLCGELLHEYIIYEIMSEKYSVPECIRNALEKTDEQIYRIFKEHKEQSPEVQGN
eukprot:TRINITY_DN8039_c0_g1_i2.p1 TRINITY_DN8039_c0_g1~~TRINITY_DN8039_c0_g1_i2.p1  ORF type:complete len:387 (-),score=83.09 TRINITY_DN8039_c0_g1_i2:617-1777(-)